MSLLLIAGLLAFRSFGSPEAEPPPAVDAEPARGVQPPVIKRWLESCRETRTVRAKFSYYRYDHAFRVCLRGAGEVCFKDADHASWFVGPMQRDLPATCRVRETDYKVRPCEPERWIWQEDLIRSFSERDKTYEEVRKSGGSMPRLRSLSLISLLFPSLDHWSIDLSPVPMQVRLLPGHPDKHALDGWSLEVTQEEPARVRLRGTPPPERNRSIRSCELILGTNEGMPLEALKYVDFGGNETVLIFHDVELNPQEIPEFDLSGYRRAGFEMP